MAFPERIQLEQDTAIAAMDSEFTGDSRPDFVEVADRFGMTPGQVSSYLAPDEQLTGFGSGGSESLVMFINSPVYGRIVRKVCSENLSAVPWDPNGTGVMTPPSTKGGLQVDYLTNLPQDVRPYFPAVHNVRTEDEPMPDGGTKRRLIYDQTMLTGTEVSTFVAEAQPSPQVVAHLHQQVMQLLADKVHAHRIKPNTEDTIQESYLDKIEARLALSRQAAPETFGSLLDAPGIIINGQGYRNIRELLDFLERPEVCAMLEPQQHTLVMGDTNTENVMITNPQALLDAMRQPGQPEFSYDDLGLKFLDPRAIGYKSVGGTTVDDPMYDNKPVHNSLGNYDVVHNEHFSLAVDRRGQMPRVGIDTHADNPYSQPYEDMSDHFAYIMDGWGVSGEDFRQKDPNWLLRFTFMMGTHFAAMPPFHFKKGPEGEVPEDPEMQKRAIAIYCEGIKWLNHARDMVVGQRQELYGVPVGQIKPDNRA
jgi:hypothetical protein